MAARTAAYGSRTGCRGAVEPRPQQTERLGGRVVELGEVEGGVTAQGLNAQCGLGQRPPPVGRSPLARTGGSGQPRSCAVDPRYRIRAGQHRPAGPTARLTTRSRADRRSGVRCPSSRQQKQGHRGVGLPVRWYSGERVGKGGSVQERRPVSADGVGGGAVPADRDQPGTARGGRDVTGQRDAGQGRQRAPVRPARSGASRVWAAAGAACGLPGRPTIQRRSGSWASS